MTAPTVTETGDLVDAWENWDERPTAFDTIDAFLVAVATWSRIVGADPVQVRREMARLRRSATAGPATGRTVVERHRAWEAARLDRAEVLAAIAAEHTPAARERSAA